MLHITAMDTQSIVQPWRTFPRVHVFLMLYFGICCCQEELQCVHKVSQADVGCLQPSTAIIFLISCTTWCQTWPLRATFLQSAYMERCQQLFYLVKIILPNKNDGRGKEQWIVFLHVCVTSLPKGIWPHFTAQLRELPSRSQIQPVVQVLLMLSQAKILPFCL